MKRIYLFALVMFLSCQKIQKQDNDIWIAFKNKEGLKGFKDKLGKVKIVPKFGVLTSAKKFDNIIGVSEEKGNIAKSYYLTKNGKVVGRDSLYAWDWAADCESEGYILFRNKKTNKVGMLNKDGNVTVQANYNFLTPVRNGLIIGTIGAHWDESKRSEVFPYPWIDGKIVLMDVHQNILVKDFSDDEEIDLFSLKISDQPTQDTIRQNFKGVNGKYYSFINFQKEFKDWLKASLLNTFTKEKLLAASFRNICVQRIGIPKASTPTKQAFVEKYFETLKIKLLQLNSTKCQYSISTDVGLNPYEYTAPEFERYFDNCGNSKNWIYPVKQIVINNNFYKKDFSQDQFEFLRTDDGYKLISVSMKTK